MGRERIAREAERTDPQFSSDIDLAMNAIKSMLGAYMSDTYQYGFKTARQGVDLQVTGS